MPVEPGDVFVAGRPLRCADVLGLGAESVVYAVADDPQRAVKIYREPDAERSSRLRHMLQVYRAEEFVIPHTGHPGVVWPEELACDSGGTVLGYVMQRSDHQPLSALFEHRSRLTRFPTKGWRFLLGVASNLSQLVAILHEYDIVVGDLAPSNVHVREDGLVSLLDCDSFQFRHDGEMFECRTVTPEYAAPELQPMQAGPKSVETDRFALAVVVSQLLLCGDHPFQGIPARSLDVDPSRDSNIRYGITALTDPRAVDVPVQSVDPAILPPRVATLAKQAFGAGHSDTVARPTAEEWAEALDAAWENIRACGDAPTHAYSSHLSTCPWCDRAAAGRFEVFPALAPTGSLPRQRAAAPAEPDAAPPAPWIPAAFVLATTGAVLTVVLIIVLILVL